VWIRKRIVFAFTEKCYISYFLNKMRISVVGNMKETNCMKKVRCECGEEILLLPDVKEMSKAVEVHVALHLEGVLGSQPCSAEEADRLRDALIEQIFRLAGESQDDEENK
jgi:hypothetical protein